MDLHFPAVVVEAMHARGWDRRDLRVMGPAPQFLQLLGRSSSAEYFFHLPDSEEYFPGQAPTRSE